MGTILCAEMKKLRTYLTEHEIEWYDDSSYSPLFWMVRTKFTHNGKEYSVINGYGSYGGFVNGKNEGLLEMMIDNCEPVGHLTAKEVIKCIEKT